MLKRIQLMIVIVLSLFGAAHVVPVQWAGNGHYYQKVDVPEGITWYDARTAAQAITNLGVAGHLVTITSSAENIFLTVNEQLGDGEDYDEDRYCSTDGIDCNYSDTNIYPGGPEVRIKSPLIEYRITISPTLIFCSHIFLSPDFWYYTGNEKRGS